MTWLFAICVALAFLAALCFVPVVRATAHLCGIVDRPDKERKLHEVPVALGGGIAVFLAVTIAFALSVLIDRQLLGGTMGPVSYQWCILFVSAAAMLAVGFVDDVWALRGRQKLLLQCLIIACLVGSGSVIEKIGILGSEVTLGVFAYPITIVWLLVAVNALNLIDGADGVASTAGAIICLGFGFLNVISGDMLAAVIGFTIAGALAGFLVFNRPPATIYLGDAGSMMIGLFVGVLAIWSNIKESTVLSSAPLAILAIPLFDSTAAILRRWLTGRSIYATDRAHLHHLLHEKYGSSGMLLVVALICGTTTALAVLSHYLHHPALAIFGVVVVVAGLVGTRSFGHAEAKLVMGQAAHFARSLTTAPDRHLARHHRSVSLQGDGPWETIWEPLVDFAESNDLAKVKIDLSLSWLHEGYHANWQSIRMPERTSLIGVCVPLFANRSGEAMQVGRLELYALATNSYAYEVIQEIGDQLADISSEIERIAAQLEANQNAGKGPRVVPPVPVSDGQPIVEAEEPAAVSQI